MFCMVILCCQLPDVTQWNVIMSHKMQISFVHGAVLEPAKYPLLFPARTEATCGANMCHMYGAVTGSA